MNAMSTKQFNNAALQDSVAEPSLADVISQRRSFRAFAGKIVEDEKVAALFEAARWAPSSMNEQPWIYVYAHAHSELYNKIVDSLSTSNKIWAAKAPLLIVSVVKEKLSRNGAHNPIALHDIGMANLALTFKATALGLNTHIIGGFSAVSLAGALHLSADTKPVVVIAVGYPGNADELPEELKKREHAPRMRKTHAEFVFTQPLQS